jgi:hypothetical protein
MKSEPAGLVASSVAVDHIRVEPTDPARFERSNPRNGLTAKLIDEGVVLDGEGNLPSRFRKHDAPQTAHSEERFGVEPALPNLVHHAAPDRGNTVGTREAETPLNLWVEPVKVGSKNPLIN